MNVPPCLARPPPRAATTVPFPLRPLLTPPATVKREERREKREEKREKREKREEREETRDKREERRERRDKREERREKREERSVLECGIYTRCRCLPPYPPQLLPRGFFVPGQFRQRRSTFALHLHQFLLQALHFHQPARGGRFWQHISISLYVI
jgi:hypothetical protein